MIPNDPCNYVKHIFTVYYWVVTLILYFFNKDNFELLSYPYQIGFYDEYVDTKNEFTAKLFGFCGDKIAFEQNTDF